MFKKGLTIITVLMIIIHSASSYLVHAEEDNKVQIHVSSTNSGEYETINVEVTTIDEAVEINSISLGDMVVEGSKVADFIVEENGSYQIDLEYSYTSEDSKLANDYKEVMSVEYLVTNIVDENKTEEANTNELVDGVVINDNWLTRHLASMYYGDEELYTNLTQEDFERVYNIDFSYSEINEIPSEIGRLRNLKTLDLSGNSIKTIPDELLNLKKLDSLLLSNNEISELPNWFGSLETLTTLELDRNLFESIPSEIGNLVNLVNLNLSYNPISSVDETFGDLVNLNKLELDETKLTSMPSQLFDLINLKYLSMNSSNLTELPKGIGELVNLEFINLSNNKLTNLPDEIVNLINLDKIVLWDNEFEEITDSILSLINLEVLYLYGNSIKEIPVEITKLKNLKELELYNNEIEELPKELFELNNIEILDLRANKISEIPLDILKLEKLNSLNLSYNKIVEIPSELASHPAHQNFQYYSQTITLPEMLVIDGTIEVVNPIKYFGSIIPPKYLESVNYDEKNNTVKFTGLSWESSVSYYFDHKITPNSSFDGNVVIPITFNTEPTIDANDLTLKVGEIFNPLLNVSALDKEDGDITSSIKVIENTVDTSKVGEYTVTYEVSDKQGGTTRKTIIVTVIPKLEGLNNLPSIDASDLMITVSDVFNPLLNVSALDKEDGDITGSIKVLENTVDTSKVGEYTVTYEVSDKQGGTTRKTIKVKVNPKLEELNNLPIILASDLVITVGDEFNPLLNVSASDKEDGDLTSLIKVIENTVDTSKVGEYTVTYEVADSNGAKTIKTIKVIVEAKPLTPPTGDSNNLLLYFITLIISLIGGLFLTKKIKKAN